MTIATIRRRATLVVLLGLLSAPALADPMKCSGEEKTCVAACKTMKGAALSLCVTNCGARLSMCMKTGCWDNGTSRYCLKLSSIAARYEVKTAHG